MTRGELVALVLGFFVGWTLRPLYELLAMQWKAERIARHRDRELEQYLRPVRPPPAPRSHGSNGLPPGRRPPPPPNPPPLRLVGGYQPSEGDGRGCGLPPEE